MGNVFARFLDVAEMVMDGCVDEVCIRYISFLGYASCLAKVARLFALMVRDSLAGSRVYVAWMKCKSSGKLVVVL